MGVRDLIMVTFSYNGGNTMESVVKQTSNGPFILFVSILLAAFAGFAIQMY